MIETLVRPNILNLKSYNSARDLVTTGEGNIFLDANENPYGTLNRYPDPHQYALKSKLAVIKQLTTEHIFLGNGSDEVIDLALRIFCEQGKDKVLICPPTYGMYQVAADINNIDTIKAPLTSDFQLDINTILEKAETEKVKIIFLCSPNNPTGNSLNHIDLILQHFRGIVFIDEAYIDFCNRPSFISKLNTYPNLIVSQTLSKGRGLANVRVGMAFANPEIIQLYNRVKPPYNISGINQKAAIEALEDTKTFHLRLQSILAERERLRTALKAIPCIQHVYPTDANFFLVACKDANNVYKQLSEKGILVRNRQAQIPHTLRISIGTPEENQSLLKTLRTL